MTAQLVEEVCVPLAASLPRCRDAAAEALSAGVAALVAANDAADAAQTQPVAWTDAALDALLASQTADFAEGAPSVVSLPTFAEFEAASYKV
jgi:hypothetical protein